MFLIFSSFLFLWKLFLAGRILFCVSFTVKISLIFFHVYFLTLRADIIRFFSFFPSCLFSFFLFCHCLPQVQSSVRQLQADDSFLWCWLFLSSTILASHWKCPWGQNSQVTVPCSNQEAWRNSVSQSQWRWRRWGDFPSLLDLETAFLPLHTFNNDSEFGVQSWLFHFLLWLRLY